MYNVRFRDETAHGVDADCDFREQTLVRGPHPLLFLDEPEGIVLGKLAGGNLEVRRNPRVNARPVRNRIAVAGPSMASPASEYGPRLPRSRPW